ncbi:alpha/beta fold hydrolase [Nocardia ignorata]|uniref:Secretory lipase n=1 Tax=Nocardia ignorata TaxID=145285 RepID=A0A4R6P202_NOCIG|nr:alpha/beta fold hydrolase [Nocardia ignorata]TDP28410.1 secretory lipase [Nocardia ignorata]
MTAGAVAAVAALLCGVQTPPANAAPEDFYNAPADLTATAPGDVLRTEPLPLALSIPSTDGAFPGRATRILYRSNDTHGNPIAVSGLFLDPTTAWTGPGERPLITLAVGTQGQGDACAPSKTAGPLLGYTPPLGLTAGYEMPAIELLAARGFAVVVTDYHGLGTPGVHDWLNREATAHAVLDAARAAKNLTPTTLTSTAPVGIWGYSQGGGAAAAAAELQPRYAPELDVRGTFAGAPPADPLRLLSALDATIDKGYIAWALNGLAADYPQAGPEIRNILSPAGQTWLQESATQCYAENIARYGPLDSRVWTRTGETISSAITRNPVLRELLAQQNIGALAPNAPVLMVSNAADDIVPHPSVEQLATDWCAKGVVVQLDGVAEVPAILPGTSAVHLLTYPLAIARGLDWMTQRLTDVPAPNTCTR